MHRIAVQLSRMGREEGKSRQGKHPRDACLLDRQPVALRWRFAEGLGFGTPDFEWMTWLVHLLFGFTSDSWVQMTWEYVGDPTRKSVQATPKTLSPFKGS